MKQETLQDKARVCFQEFLTGKGLKPESIIRKKTELIRFFKYINKQLHKDLRDITSRDIETYFMWVKDKGFSRTTLGATRSMLADLFYTLNSHELIMTDPMELTDIVVREKAGIKKILSEREMAKFLNTIETVTGYGLRDRSLFELMYVTGMRAGEIVRLNVDDLDLSTNEVMVCQSKGRKDRIVPLGRVAKHFIERWLKVARLYFLKDVNKNGKALFLSERGSRLSVSLIRYRMKRHLKQAGIKSLGISSHSIRHSTATHLLQNGADIVYVAELLGHESLVTTQVYTAQIVEGLKKTHKMYHPRENQLYPDDL